MLMTIKRKKLYRKLPARKQGRLEICSKILIFPGDLSYELISLYLSNTYIENVNILNLQYKTYV